jgi:hypothetical protein
MKITTAHHCDPDGGVAPKNHSASQEDGIVNEATGADWRWCRPWPRRAGFVAVTAGIVLLVAACGGGSSTGSGGSSSTAISSSTAGSSSTSASSTDSGGSSSTTVGSAGSGGSSNTGESGLAQQNLAFAKCMRSDGVTDFPDPRANGEFGTISAQLEHSPRFGTGFNACKHLLPDRGVGKAQQDGPQLLKFAQCMHAHGVPTYPEPGPASPYSSISNTAVDSLRELGPGVNPNSPVVQRAVQTCERLNPVGSR